MMTRPRTSRTRTYAVTVIFLFVVWLLLSGTLAWEEVTVGLLIAVLVAVLASAFPVQENRPRARIHRAGFLLIYIPVFFWEMLKANFDVAYRVVHPKMPIRPGIVQIKTNLRSDIAKLILGNSITLTPGTLTIEIVGDNLLIHWINVQTEDVKQATAIIGERFEKYLKVVFE